VRTRHPSARRPLPATQRADDVQPPGLYPHADVRLSRRRRADRDRRVHAPADLVRVREKTLINATGYGARALFDDASVIPIRGQLARMIPQPQVDYGLIYKGVAFVPRRDGLVFQVIGETDYYGFNDETTVPDRAEAE